MVKIAVGGAYAQRQRQQYGKREAGVPEQPAHAEVEIPQKVPHNDGLETTVRLLPDVLRCLFAG